MHVWTLKEAEEKFADLVDAAKYEPQVIAREGVHEVVVMDMDKYLELTGWKSDVEKFNSAENRSIVSFLRGSALYDNDIELDRDQSEMSDMDFLDEHEDEDEEKN